MYLSAGGEKTGENVGWQIIQKKSVLGERETFTYRAGVDGPQKMGDRCRSCGTLDGDEDSVDIFRRQGITV